MSYTVLARRYRSSNFDELLGQEHIANTLKRAIETDRIAHAFLFCGTRGTGKTSAARILAKALNCESSKKPTPNPCGKCGSCQGIARGDDMDVLEIDAASNNGIDEVRDIIANSSYTPARSRFKVYIIDEVHAMSKNAFNALLKLLEEPPSHVKFILATTEPEKLLPTILSRCQRYDFRNIPTPQIAAHLKNILAKEKINADEDAILLVAKSGAGSMRDALSLLDRLLSFNDKDLSVRLIEEMLGLPRASLVFELAQHIGTGDVKGTLTKAEELVSNGFPIDTLVGQLSDHLRNLLILRTCGPTDLVQIPGLSPAEMLKQASAFDPTALAQDIVILEELRRQLRTSNAARALLDATLVRLTLAEQFTSIAELLSAQTADAPGQKKKFEIASPNPPFPHVAEATHPKRVSPEPAPVAPVSRVPEVVSEMQPVDDSDDDLPRPGKVWSNDGPSLSELLRQQSQLTTPDLTSEEKTGSPAAVVGSNIAPANVQDLSATWQSLLGILMTRSPGVHGLLSHARLARIQDNQATIALSDAHRGFARILETNAKRDVLTGALSEIVGKTVGVRIEVDAPSDPATTQSVPATAAPDLAPSRAASPNPAPLRTPGRPTPAPQEFVPAPARPGAPPTPEQQTELMQDKFIAALVQELGAEIRWVE